MNIKSIPEFYAYRFGQKIGPFLEKEGAKWTAIVVGIIGLLIAAIYFLFLK